MHFRYLMIACVICLGILSNVGEGWADEKEICILLPSTIVVASSNILPTVDNYYAENNPLKKEWMYETLRNSKLIFVAKDVHCLIFTPSTEFNNKWQSGFLAAAPNKRVYVRKGTYKHITYNEVIR